LKTFGTNKEQKEEVENYKKSLQRIRNLANKILEKNNKFGTK
jgi:hypothetical protein